MIILVDLDDTVWNLLPAWVNYLNNKHNLSVSIQDIKEWDMSIAYPTLREAELLEPLIQEDFWLYEVEVKKDAQKYLKKIQSLGHEIFFVTATDYRNVPIKLRLIEKYFNFIPKNNVIISHRKDLIKGDLLIDDYIENFRGRDTGILFTSAFNKYIIEPSNLVRCDNWEQVYYYIIGRSV